MIYINALRQVSKLSHDRCPVCNFLVNAHAGLDKQNPKPDDVTVCLNCAFILCFNKKMQLRKATPADLADLDEKTRKSLEELLFAVNEYILAHAN